MNFSSRWKVSCTAGLLSFRTDLWNILTIDRIGRRSRCGGGPGWEVALGCCTVWQFVLASPKVHFGWLRVGEGGSLLPLLFFLGIYSGFWIFGQPRKFAGCSLRIGSIWLITEEFLALLGKMIACALDAPWGARAKLTGVENPWRQGSRCPNPN
ncbi:hypothetical protein TNCT_486241 [Trichonephila clavata]|uniref:Uncharacterized protein n=1 Tax=Trichonephila clavata TaxID=2740835 RepID=A0A8X6LFJ6_TRICU|nr:hypothetical protein TNCT_486241 [Trichonephila clavata]